MYIYDIFKGSLNCVNIIQASLAGLVSASRVNSSYETIYIYIYTHIYISLSLSIYIYIYISVRWGVSCTLKVRFSIVRPHL